MDVNYCDQSGPQGLNRLCRVPSLGTLPGRGKGSVRGPFMVFEEVLAKTVLKVPKFLQTSRPTLS